MNNLFMPKMRAIGVPVNDYFVEHFVDIPKSRYNKILLREVAKDKEGFHLRLDTKDQPEYFIARKDVSAPNSGYLNSYLGPQIIVPTGIGFDSIKPRVGNKLKGPCSNCFSNQIQFPPASLAIKQKHPK